MMIQDDCEWSVNEKAELCVRIIAPFSFHLSVCSVPPSRHTSSRLLLFITALWFRLQSASRDIHLGSGWRKRGLQWDWSVSGQTLYRACLYSGRSWSASGSAPVTGESRHNRQKRCPPGYWVPGPLPHPVRTLAKSVNATIVVIILLIILLIFRNLKHLIILIMDLILILWVIHSIKVYIVPLCANQ